MFINEAVFQRKHIAYLSAISLKNVLESLWKFGRKG